MHIKQAKERKLRERTVVVRNIDLVTEEEEIKSALKEYGAVSSEEEIRINTLKNNRQGTGKVATINLPEAAAEKLITEGKIKIGWVYCQVEEIVRPIRCYNCLRHGHVARECKDEARQAKKICRKCGNTDEHNVLTCTRVVHCYECKQDGHEAECMACPAYRKAVRQRKKEIKSGRAAQAPRKANMTQINNGQKH